MQSLRGCIIKATSALNETCFEAATIFITENNEGGAAGFVINKLFPRKLNELQEFKNAAPIDIHEGGPVDNEHLYLLHSIAALGGEEIADGVFFGGNFKDAVAMLSDGKLSGGQVKIFIGYCGWNAFELEAEIEEGSWEIINVKDVFHF